MTRRSTLRSGLATAACALLLTLTGCGQDTAPADAAPALGRKLDAVDAAIADHDYATARSALEALLTEASRAHDDGSIDGDQAAAIRQAASALLTRLPGATTEPTPTTPTPDPVEPAPTTTTPEDQPGPGEEHGPKGHDKPEEHGKGPGPQEHKH